MAKLKGSDRVALSRALEHLPVLQTERGRRQILEFAGLERIATQLNLEGSSFVVLNELISGLESYGRIREDKEALGVFINTLKEFVGAESEIQELFDHILREYDLMQPVRGQPTALRWRSIADSKVELERIVGENTLRHVAFLQRGLRAARAVCLIDTGEWTGTGFLVSQSLVMTNEHVLPKASIARSARFLFNYQVSEDGVEQAGQEFKAVVGGSFHCSSELDYATAEVAGMPGEVYGRCKLSNKIPGRGDRVNIIQHPAGMFKQVSIQNNKVQYSDSQIVQYLTSTLGGSSGAPVFDDEWNTVAVHHSGGLLAEPGGDLVFARNEGTTSSAILKHLPPDILEQINGRK
jgi:hypothetical protein